MVLSMQFLGLPSIAPNITAVDSDNSTCIVNWTPSDSADSYTVRWINLITKDMDYKTVPGYENSCSITELYNAIYNVTVTAVGLCGGPMESDNYTFNGECRFG